MRMHLYNRPIPLLPYILTTKNPRRFFSHFPSSIIHDTWSTDFLYRHLQLLPLHRHVGGRALEQIVVVAGDHLLGGCTGHPSRIVTMIWVTSTLCPLAHLVGKGICRPLLRGGALLWEQGQILPRGRNDPPQGVQNHTPFSSPIRWVY